MPRHTAKLAAVQIANTDTESGWIRADEFHGSATQVIAYGPAVLEAHTYTIEVTDNPDATSPVVRTLQTEAGVDRALPGQGDAFPISELLGTVAFRIKSDGAITDEDEAVWGFSAQEEY